MRKSTLGQLRATHEGDLRRRQVVPRSLQPKWLFIEADGELRKYGSNTLVASLSPGIR
ncbi:MAG: hypothetical protein U0744_08640 [Gemmataceae bacterium]